MKLLQNHTPKDGLQTHDVHSISKWGTPSYQANKRNTIEDQAEHASCVAASLISRLFTSTDPTLIAYSVDRAAITLWISDGFRLAAWIDCCMLPLPSF